ncbi:G-type lectin S-receptor-like serine/threonine-protein kinase CES101 [Tanacetum coccineum]
MVSDSDEHDENGDGSDASDITPEAWELWNKGRGLEFMDALLENRCSHTQVMTCIHAGLLCVQDHATDRPTMSEVINMLTNENMHLPPKQPAFFIERHEAEAAKR